jgi:hypothetical protein
LGVNYQLKDRLKLIFQQGYSYNGSYYLANMVTPYKSHAGGPSQPASINYFGVRIEDLSYWTTQVGLSYEF